MTLPTLGVEEELLLLDPDTGVVDPVAPTALAAHRERWPSGTAGAPRVEAELFQQQLELATEPCGTLDELRRSLVKARTAALEAAGAAGAVAVRSRPRCWPAVMNG